MEELLRYEHVDISYNGIPAVQDVSFTLRPGEILGIVGESGCGKSTFLKTLNRMNELVQGVRIQGKVSFEGQDIYSPQTDVSELRRSIGMVFQKPNPFPMSIYDNVAYGPRTHGTKAKARLDEIVETSLRDAAIWDEVKDRLKSNALGLSGGQQQRLCIARALISKPKIIILDDSTSAVDTATDAAIRKALNEELSSTTTIIIAQRIASVMDADRIVIMNEGKIDDVGTHAELMQRSEIYREVCQQQANGGDNDE